MRALGDTVAFARIAHHHRFDRLGQRYGPVGAKRPADRAANPVHAGQVVQDLLRQALGLNPQGDIRDPLPAALVAAVIAAASAASALV